MKLAINRNGFTLLELLLVIVILSMVVLIGVIGIRQQATHMLALKTSNQMENWLQAAYTYYGYKGEWPNSLGDAQTYAPDVSTTNPWNKPYIIVQPEQWPHLFQITTDVPSQELAQQIAGNLTDAKVTQSVTADLFTVTARVVQPSGKAANGTNGAFIAGRQLPSFQSEPPDSRLPPYETRVSPTFVGYPWKEAWYEANLFGKTWTFGLSPRNYYIIQIPNCTYYNTLYSNYHFLPVLIVDPGSLTWEYLAQAVTVWHWEENNQVVSGWLFYDQDIYTALKNLDSSKVKMFPFMVARCIRSDFLEDKIFTVRRWDSTTLPNPFVVPIYIPGPGKKGCAAGWDPKQAFESHSAKNAYNTVKSSLDFDVNDGKCAHKCTEDVNGLQRNVICAHVYDGPGQHADPPVNHNPVKPK